MKLILNDNHILSQKLADVPLVIYGMGYVGTLVAEWCAQNGIAYMFCDGNAEQKRRESGEAVLSPEQLAENYSNANVVVASINYYDEIRERLGRLGFEKTHILSYLDFWPAKFSWQELEDTADWENVRRRAEIFASWVDPSAKSVADYSFEKNFLKDFLPDTVRYEAPDYIRFRDNVPYADLSGIPPEFHVDVSSCLAMLMSFQEPEALIDQMCATTKKAVIASYVPLEQLPDIRFRRSIHYYSDYTEQQFISAFTAKGFQLVRIKRDPFDAVHTVYLFEKR